MATYDHDDSTNAPTNNIAPIAPRPFGLADILSTKHRLTRVNLPLTDESGAQGYVFCLPLRAGAVIDFISEGAKGVNAEGVPILAEIGTQQLAMMRFIARHICDSNGVLLFDDKNTDQMRSMPNEVFNALQGHMTSAIVEGNETGKASVAPPTTETETPPSTSESSDTTDSSESSSTDSLPS